MVSEREDDSSSGDHKQKWRPLSAPPCFAGGTKPSSTGLDLLKSKRICRSEPCIFLKEYRLCSAFQRLRRTRSRMGCRRTTPTTGKNEGIINVLRRRALSRHFSNSFASSLDISSASQNSSCGLYLAAGTTAPPAIDCCSNVLQVLNGYSRSTSSGYASRRSSLSGSPFPGALGDVHSCVANWSDVSQSGNYNLPGSSTPRSKVAGSSSLHSLIAGTIGDLENDVVEAVESPPTLVGQLFAVRFPQLKRQMENRIRSLVSRMESDLDYQKSSLLASDGTARFVYSHILEMAKDCLHRCDDGAALDVDYFNAVSDELQRMLRESKEKCGSSNGQQSPVISLITACVDEFLLAVARTADVLECLDSNPSDFYCALTAVENQLNVMLPDSRDIPRYVLSQLKTSISLNEQSVYARLLQEYKAAIPAGNSQPSAPTISDFSVLKRISAGSYGSVYLVQHKASGKYMALKRLSKKSVCRKNFIQQVFTERDILTFIQNPFVVSLLCSFETEHDLCLVMEYVEGGDVRSLLDYVNGPLSVDMATLYFAETTLAVEYIHSYGIVHRDIKPSNLLITAHGHIKLTDFGLSRIGLADLTCSQFHDNQVIGTPQYIAPEVILRTGYGQPVDWWSMGILLYEMLVGCTPFTADNVDVLFELIVSGEVEWPEYLMGSAAKELIEMLLRRNPSQRPHYIRNHRFFVDIDWEQLLVRKAAFVPVLESPDDTSYFRQNKTTCNNTAASTTENASAAGGSSNNDDILQHFYFSSYAPSFASSVSSSNEKVGNLDSTSDSGGSLGSSLHNLSISPGNLADADTGPPPVGTRKLAAAAAAKPKGRRFRGSLLRARSFFLKRVLAADKKNNNLREICINRHQTDGYGFTFATYPSAKEQGRYVHQVLSVTSDGPAYKAGVRKGNTIAHVNQKDVSGLTHTGVLRLVQRTKHVLHVDLSNDNHSNNDCTDSHVPV